jgi:hypothetical protein
MLYAVRKLMAEEVGFEPTVPYGTTVFKTAAFDLSATPPVFINHDTTIWEICRVTAFQVQYIYTL